jgi:hypothetical protein
VWGVMHQRDVRFWPKADMPTPSSNVCYWGESGHGPDMTECPLMTQSGHSHLFDGLHSVNRFPRVSVVAVFEILSVVPPFA